MSLQSVYGWTALQYQAWARGSLVVEGSASRSVLFYTEGILEFWIDDEHFFGGDLYSYRRAPLILQLKPGNHRVDLRLIRDVRIMGGVGKPEIVARFEAQISAFPLAITIEKLLVPDMVGGFLASNRASVPVRNEGQEWIEIWDILSTDVCIRHTQRSNAR